jgi:biopolymer transport protein TolR
MNYQLEVCLVALALITGVTPSVAAQSQQAMQKGISVELPVTKNAVAMPDADQGDAVIVSVTDGGGVYLGVNPISPVALAETVKRGLANRTEKKLYIKADARTPYANVLKVLDAAHTADVEALNLLTAQRDSSESETLVPPKRAGSVGWSTIALQIGGDRRASAQLGAAKVHPKGRRRAHSMGHSAKYTKAVFPEQKRESSSNESRGDIAIC